MLSFYGRKSPRNLKHVDLENLKNWEFFFTSNNIQKLKTQLKIFTSINLEIGFGLGENLLFQSSNRKNEIFLGCDPYLGGSINIHKQIQKLNLKNLFITNLEFFELYEFVKELKFNNITILFPDPWPKKKHLKRRLINYKFVQYITKLSNKRTKVIVSTDDEDYLNQIIYAFHKSSEFTLSTNLINENIMKYFNVQITKYYKKAKLDNRKSYFLLFEKEIS